MRSMPLSSRIDKDLFFSNAPLRNFGFGLNKESLSNSFDFVE